MVVKDVIGVVMGIIVLAGLSVAILNGGQTASVIAASGTAFTGLIGAATHPGKY
ncbi:MAG: hypothetical protein ACYDHE_17080 [Candidatus Acidiferrales bacterium]